MAQQPQKTVTKPDPALNGKRRIQFALLFLACFLGLFLLLLAGLGTYFGDLGPFLGLYGRSWAALGASIGGLGCTWAALGAYVGDLGPLLGLYSRSWSALGAAVCGPVPLLEPILAVLAALGGYLGGLRPLLRPRWAVWF